MAGLEAGWQSRQPAKTGGHGLVETMKAGIPSRRLGLGPREVQYLLLVAGDAAWLYAWSLGIGVWMGGDRRELLPLTAVLALLIVSLITTRLLSLVRRRPLVARTALALLGVAVAWVVALAELPALRSWGQWGEAWNQLFYSDRGGRIVVTVGFAVFAWRRGILFGRSRPGVETVATEFQTGVVALASLFIPVALSGPLLPIPSDVLLIAAMVTICCGLIGMPLARVVEVSEAQARRGVPVSGPMGSWLGVLLSVVGGILVVTLAVSQLLTFDRIVAVYEVVRGPVGDFLWAVVYVIGVPVGLLVQVFLYILSILIPSKARPKQPQAGDTDWLDRLKDQGELATLSPEMVLALKIALGVALAAVAVFLLVRAFLRMRAPGEQDGVEETRDSVWAWPRLRDLWRWLMGRLQLARRRVATVIAGPGDTAPDNRGVRGLYREFLTLGLVTGRGRKPAETPLEYETRLGGTTAGSGEVRLITESYVRVRYARPSSQEPDLSAVAAALARLRELWRARRK